MGVRARFIIVAVAFLSTAFPSSALAQRCVGEDVAAIDQYCETLLGAEGDAPVSGGKERLRNALPADVRKLLERSGVEGRALLAMPVGVPTSGDAKMRIRRLPGAMAAVKGTLAENADSGAPAKSVGSLVSGDALGSLFRWALLLSTLGMVGVAWVRHRR